MKKLFAFLLLVSLATAHAAAQPTGLRVWSNQDTNPAIPAGEATATDADPPLEAADPAIAAPAPSIDEAMPAAAAEKLVGASVVIDPAHIAQTINNIQQAYQRYLQLVEMVEKAERELERLSSIPFVDSENYTGAFLANMRWLLVGGNYDELNPELVEETLGYSHPEIARLLGEYFPGPRIVPGASEEPALRPDPWATYENPAELYFARDNAMLTTAYRVAEVLENHAAQVSRERQGISRQRDQMEDGVDGNAQHLEMLFAALHQSLDAQSVERQVDLLGANLQYLTFVDEVNARLEQRTRTWNYISTLRETLEIESLTSVGGAPVGLDRRP